jgi:hypothetical protein
MNAACGGAEQMFQPKKNDRLFLKKSHKKSIGA